MGESRDTGRRSRGILGAAVLAVAAVLAALLWSRIEGDSPDRDLTATSPSLRPASSVDGHEIVRPLPTVGDEPESRGAGSTPDVADEAEVVPDEVEEGYHLEPNIAGGDIKVPDGFHVEFDVGTFVVEDGHHIEYDPDGRVRIIEDGFGLGPDGMVYTVTEGHHLEATSDGTVWEVADGHAIGPDDEVYEVAEGYHLEIGPDGTVWEIEDGTQLGPDGNEYDVLDGYHLEMDAEGNVHQVADREPSAADDAAGEGGEGQVEAAP